MTIDQQTALSEEETNRFLGSHETGVLALAHADDPYAVPVSYGYDSDERLFYLRLVSTEDSRKQQFLTPESQARLVVYEETDGTYRSVVAAGRLEEITREELSVDHVNQYGDAKRPLFEMWGEPRSDLDVQLFRLRPDDLSGRQVEFDREA